MGPFADSHVESMTPAQLARFERLLDQPDRDLYAWVTGTAPTPAAFDHDIMARLRAFRPAQG